ncbi:MAG: molybdopterin-binding protein [Pseudomonadota bacterium]|nr:molybdopterin-binding protein [Pseudomonadota bacterium]
MRDADFRPSRRLLLRGALAGAGVSLLSGCEALSGNEAFVDVLATAEPLTARVQRMLTGNRLAPEYQTSMISPVFRANGSINPQTSEYLALKANNFSDYRLRVRGLVRKPLEFSLDALRAMPARSQITRHDCVEGWSVIGGWAGVPLATMLDLAEVKPGARYVVFHCFDDLSNDGSRYYESVDLLDAYHPQTIVAHTLNGAPIPVGNGAPVRMRIERKLGYKMPKYVHTIELVDAYARFGGGKGGYWEDLGYDWYGGI